MRYTRSNLREIEDWRDTPDEFLYSEEDFVDEELLEDLACWAKTPDWDKD